MENSVCEALTNCQCPECHPLGSGEGYRASWRHVSAPYLCVNRNSQHIQLFEHWGIVVQFLSKRGLNDAARAIETFGIAAADRIAAMIDWQEAAGEDWAAGVTSRGGYIYSLIRRAAEVRQRGR